MREEEVVLLCDNVNKMCQNKKNPRSEQKCLKC